MRYLTRIRAAAVSLLALTVALTPLVLTGCDTSTPVAPAIPASEAVPGYDAAVVAKAEALREEVAEDASTSLTFDTSPRPLLQFDSAEDFERMAEALETVSIAAGNPLRLHAALEPYAGPEYDLAIPKGGLALTNESGQFLIADHLYTIRRSGDQFETVITDAKDGSLVESYVLRPFSGSATDALAGGEREFEVDHDEDTDIYTIRAVQPLDQQRIKADSEDEWIAIGNNAIQNKQGEFKYVWSVYAHSAYRTTFGAKRANAQSEFRWSDSRFLSGNIDFFLELYSYEGNTANFDIEVFGGVQTEYYGCRYYQGYSPTYSPARIYSNAGGSRGTGQGVYYSRHHTRDRVTGQFVHGPYLLDGEDNDRDCRL